MISINVRSTSDKHLTNVEVSFEDLQTITALMLKEMVYEACGIPIAQQTLINSAGAKVSDADPLFSDSLGLLQSRYLQFVVGAADILPVQLSVVERKIEMLCITVGHCHRPCHRAMVNLDGVPQEEWDAGASMSREGWTHLLSFWAFRTWQPGTLRVAVGQAQAPHRVMFNQGDYSQAEWDAGKSMSTKGWTHEMEFWAVASPEPGAIRIAVGEAWSPHRMMINHDSKSQAEWDAGASMSTARWTHKMEFGAFLARLEDSVLAQMGTAQESAAGMVAATTEN